MQYILTQDEYSELAHKGSENFWKLMKLVQKLSTYPDFKDKLESLNNVLEGATDDKHLGGLLDTYLLFY